MPLTPYLPAAMPILYYRVAVSVLVSVSVSVSIMYTVYCILHTIYCISFCILYCTLYILYMYLQQSFGNMADIGSYTKAGTQPWTWAPQNPIARAWSENQCSLTQLIILIMFIMHIRFEFKFKCIIIQIQIIRLGAVGDSVTL